MATLEQSIHSTVSREISDRLFGLVMGAIFLILAVVPLVLGSSLKPVLFWVAGSLLGVAVVCPLLLKWPKVIWFFITRKIAFVVNYCLLAVIFFGVVTPVALFFKMVGRDALSRKWDPSAASYWVNRDPKEAASSSMKRQF